LIIENRTTVPEGHRSSRGCGRCGQLASFCEFIPAKYGLDVIVGTHPIPQDYYLTHGALGTWQSARWQEVIQHVWTDEETRRAYD
jgi:hypothetical protein